MIHVTANEAGRNAVFKDKLLLSIDALIDGVVKGELKKRRVD